MSCNLKPYSFIDADNVSDTRNRLEIFKDNDNYHVDDLIHTLSDEEKQTIIDVVQDTSNPTQYVHLSQPYYDRRYFHDEVFDNPHRGEDGNHLGNTSDKYLLVVGVVIAPGHNQLIDDLVARRREANLDAERIQLEREKRKIEARLAELDKKK